MNEDSLNMQTRKFLKKVGIHSQREIEQAVTNAIEEGSLESDGTLDVQMTLAIPALGINQQIDGKIELAEK